jgi:osmotically inducible protein OsmC
LQFCNVNIDINITNTKMQRKAQAHWAGNIKEGKGNLSTQSGVLNQTNYSFRTRFVGDESGTNPEELLAAAHAGCFTMAVSYALTEKGLTSIELDTEAIVTMDGTGIKSIHLSREMYPDLAPRHLRQSQRKRKKAV